MIKRFLFLILVLTLFVGCSVDGERALEAIKNGNFAEGSGTNIPYWTNTKTPFFKVLPQHQYIRAESSTENLNVIEHAIYQEFLVNFNVVSANFDLGGTILIGAGSVSTGFVEFIAKIQKPDNEFVQIAYLKKEEEGYHFEPNISNYDITSVFNQLGYYKLWIYSNLKSSDNGEQGIQMNRIIIYGASISIEAPIKRKMIFERAEGGENLSWAKVKKNQEQAEASESLSYQILPYKRFFKDSTEIAQSRESLQAKITSGNYERNIIITDRATWQEIGKKTTEWEEVEKKETEWE